jgi:hypothetical protein
MASERKRKKKLSNNGPKPKTTQSNDSGLTNSKDLRSPSYLFNNIIVTVQANNTTGTE